MIISRLAGGLGNQMFQYAVARKYLKSNHESIFFDTYLLQEEEEDIEKIIHRPYALGIFKNLKGTVNEEKIADLLRNTGWINKVKRKLYLNNCIKVEQQNMERIELPPQLENSKNLWFIGNFQSERFFKHIRNEILNDFLFPDLDPKNKELQKKILGTPNAVSIHVRRGDYLSSHHRNVHTSVGLDYYHKGIEQLQHKLGINELNVFLFTDDIEWVKQHLTSTEKIKFNYVTGNSSRNSWKDMALMTACRHHIIANSSFSWWGAWLATHEGIKLAPKHWYLPHTYVYDINDIVPQTWEIIDYSIS